MDRYTLTDSPDLDEVHARLTEPERYLRRAQLADDAHRAWQAAQAAGDTRDLEHFQQVAIDQEVTRNRTAAARNAATLANPAGGRQAHPPVTSNPVLSYADELEAQGFHFHARRVRQEAAEAEHAARRRRVEQEVTSHDRLYRRLRTADGTDAADRFMGGDAA